METLLKGCEIEVNGSLLLLLPTHLIFDILARLSIRTLFTCKCVCSTFKNMFSDPYFMQLHLASLVIQDKHNPFKIFLTRLLDLDKANDYCNSNYFSWHTLSMPAIIHKKSFCQSVFLIGSRNGLLCLQYYANKVCRLCICNPILGEFTILPQFRGLYEFGGFGFCPKTKQYKILRFCLMFGSCDIFTLGADDWRRVSDAPPRPLRFVEFDSSYRGNLHWTVNNLICSFNLEIERYTYLSLPLDLHSRSSSLEIEIGTLDGLFCVSYILCPGNFEVYVMEDYEVHDSWIKRISINTGYDFRGYREDISIVKFLDNGVLVLSCSTTRLVYFDTRKGTSSDILVEGNYCGAFHTMSLVSLKDIVGRKNVEQVERKMFNICSSKSKAQHQGN